MAKTQSHMPRIEGAQIAKLVGVDASGAPLLELADPDGVTPLRARTTVPVGPEDAGREAVVVFEAGDSRLAIVVGLFGESSQPIAESEPERLVIGAKGEIVLRCGKSTVVLTKSGRIQIRGEYVLTRSAGVNRIRGASVQIN